MNQWKGDADAGPREYGLDARETIKEHMQDHIGWEHRTTIKAIASAVKMSGRTVRACLSDLDGTEFALAYDRDDQSLLWVARYAEEVAGYSRKLRSIAHTIEDRCQRRDPWERKLGAEQRSLFGTDTELRKEQIEQ